MLGARGSKRPSPDPEEDPSTHRPKRTRSQGDSKTAAQHAKDCKQKGKGKARAVIASRSPSLTPAAIAEQSARLEGLIRASTSNQPTTSARAEEQEAEISRLSALVAEQAAQLSRQTSQLGQVREALKCGICFDALNRPHALSPCGHVACYECLLRWFISDPNDSSSTIVRDPVATIVNGRPNVTVGGGDDNGGQVEGDDAGVPNTRATAGRTRMLTRTSAQPNPEEFARPWTIDLGIHTNTGVRRRIFPPLSRGRTVLSPPSPSTATRRAPSPVPQRSPTVSYVHKTKVCPVCRATVKERPIEMFAIRNAVEGLGEGAKTPPISHSAQSLVSDGSHNPRNPTNDPWNNIFPSLPSPRTRIQSQSPPLIPALFPLDPSHILPIPIPPMASFATTLAPFLSTSGTPGPRNSFSVIQTDGIPPIGGGRWERAENATQAREIGRRASFPSIPVTIQEPEAPSGSTPPAVARALSRSRSRRGPIQNEGSAALPEPSNGSSGASSGETSSLDPGSLTESTLASEDVQRFGLHGSDGVYRCIDCTVFHILNGECVSCGRGYPGHPRQERDGDAAEGQVQGGEGEHDDEERESGQRGSSVEPSGQDQPQAVLDAYFVESPGAEQSEERDEECGQPQNEKEGEEGSDGGDPKDDEGGRSRASSSSREASADTSTDSATDSGYASNSGILNEVRRLRSGRTYPILDPVRPSRSRQRQHSDERLRQRTRVKEAAETRRIRDKMRMKGLGDSDSEADVEEVSRTCEEVSAS